MMHYDTVLIWLQLYPFSHSHVIFAQSRKKKGKIYKNLLQVSDLLSLITNIMLLCVLPGILHSVSLFQQLATGPQFL